MDNLSRRRVAEIVSAYVRDCHPGGASLEIDESEVHRVHGQWRVPIHPSAEPVKPYQYYKALTDVEMELDEQEHLNVFLVPSDPKRSQAGEPEPPGDENAALPSLSAGKRRRPLKAVKRAIGRKAGETPLAPEQPNESRDTPSSPGLIRPCHQIEWDLPVCRLDRHVPEAALARRRREWRPPQPTHTRGWGWLYLQHVLQADQGCDFDFLRADFRANK